MLWSRRQGTYECIHRSRYSLRNGSNDPRSFTKSSHMGPNRAMIRAATRSRVSVLDSGFSCNSDPRGGSLRTFNPHPERNECQVGIMRKIYLPITMSTLPSEKLVFTSIPPIFFFSSLEFPVTIYRSFGHFKRTYSQRFPRTLSSLQASTAARANRY